MPPLLDAHRSIGQNARMIFRILFVAMILASGSGATYAKSPRPNILYFYVDDWGWGAIGPNGQAERKAKGLPYVSTPNLDRLAAEGVNFTRSYGCTVCSPARSSQQSGFHQGHTFADRNDPDNAKKAMRADDILMGDALSKAGYTTGYWGKWGYGGTKSQPDPEIVNVQTLPTSHGYQFVVAELHHVRAHTFYQPTLWNAPAKRGSVGGLELKLNSVAAYRNQSRYPNQPALQNQPDYPKTAYCDDVYAFAALDFVRENAIKYNKTGKPFFGLLGVQVPHAPFHEIEELPEWDRAYRKLGFFNNLNKQSRQWAAMVTRLDAHFGNILAALEDPNGDGDKTDSVADNTLVIFQSDNGGPQHAARNEFRANGGLRASKGSIYEGGIRIPTIMRWPAKITKNSKLRAGSSNDKVIDVTDLLPTFCELAGVDAPLGVDGVSLAPTLTGEGSQRHREFLIHEARRSASVIRGNHKLVHTPKRLELYDLEKDHAEENNIADEHPVLVKELEAILIAERAIEPKGFATTYHRWTGKGSGRSTSDSGNWSDYVYENAGLTYMTADSSPSDSWIASIRNTRNDASSVFCQGELNLLALELRGRGLVVGKDGELTARNEIRISREGYIELNGGSINTARWLNIAPYASLRGFGTVRGSVFNSGSIDLQNELTVSSDYRQENGELWVTWGSRIEVGGEAQLHGKVYVHAADGKLKQGDSFELLRAKRVAGRFELPGGIEANGYDLTYSTTNVLVTLR
ncbi:MAG: hypothetical protein CMO80_06435 [Verrucomicrobiales bacterium]|nr:hypothetical protein [Verrucomicrobiales bacterium]